MTLPDWHLQASRWQGYRAPQLPTAGDITRYSLALDDLGPGANVLLLGVTPPLVALAESRQFQLTAVDGDAEMIRRVWPGDVPGLRSAILGSWDDLPLERGAFDAIIGDGVLAFSTTANALQSRLGHWLEFLHPRGLGVVVRTFHRPEGCFDCVENVATAMLNEQLDLDAGRWKMAFALADAHGVVSLNRIHEAFVELGLEQWLTERGQELELAKFHAYRNSTFSYRFFRQAEIQKDAAGRWKRTLPGVPGAYALSEWCPLHIFR